MPNNEKPREILQILDVLRGIKQNIAAYLNKQFNRTISVSCSKYDRGGNFFRLHFFHLRTIDF